MILTIMSEGTTGTLRAALLFLVALGVGGTAVVLAYERHWDGTWQLVPWVTLGGVCIALVALLVRPTPATVWLARVLAVLVIVAAVMGLWRHFDEKLLHGGAGRPLQCPLGDDADRRALVGGHERFGWPCTRTRRWGADRRSAGDGDHWPWRTRAFGQVGGSPEVGLVDCCRRDDPPGRCPFGVL